MEPDAILKAVQEARKAALKVEADPRVLSPTKLRDYARGEQIGKNLEYYPGLVPEDPTEREAFKKRLAVLALLGPALDRFTTHILGRDPEWTASAGEAGKPLKPEDERVKGLGEWHKAGGRIHAELKRADQQMRWGGAAYLWMYTPDVYRVLSGGELKRDAATYAEALELIRLDALDTTQAGAVEQDGVKLAYWRAYSVMVDDKAQNRIEVHTRQEVTVYVEDGDKLVPASDVGENPRPNPLFDPLKPLRFPALMYEMKREAGPQITQSMVDVQNATNTTAMNVLRNNNLGGWRQYYTVNAARPVDDVTGEKTNYVFGPSRVVDVQADFLRDKEGDMAQGPNGPILLPVSVGTFDPVNSTFMREDADWFEQKLLGQLNQRWTQDESKVSGESKRESRAAFDKELPAEAQPARDALKWIIETADRFAQWVMGQDVPTDPVTVDPRLFLDVESVDLETLKVLDLMHTAGKLSLETLLESTPGVTDVAKEMERIKTERASNPTALNALRELGWDAADWLKALQGIGFPISLEAITRAEELAAAGAEALEGGEDGGDREAV